jgi:hypothetical protein
MTAIDLITKQDLADFKTELFTELKKLNIGSTTDKDRPEWLRSKEVRALLKISPGTLQNFRIKRILPSKKIGGILYYEYAKIEQIMKEGNKV